MARPRPYEAPAVEKASTPQLRALSQEAEPSPDERDSRAKALLGQITIMAIPVETYQKIEKAAADRGLRAAELMQLALVEYIDRHPPKVKE